MNTPLFKKIWILLVWLPLGVFSQEMTSSKAIEKVIDSMAQAQRASFELPGLAVGVIKDNQVIYAKGFGVQSLADPKPLTKYSLYHMASVSKPFVATAIMQLVEKGKMDLDKKLTHYLPYFKMKDPRYKAITIRHVLTHTSGIPDVKDYEWDKPQYDDGAAERYARSFGNVSLDFAPGTKQNYSNAAFDIMAAVIAKVSGTTFENYMKQNIFKPIGMVNSTFLKPEVPKKLATASHELDKNLKMAVRPVYPYNRRHAPSSTLHSNIHDMLLWAKMYLNGGVINNKQIISPKSYKALTTPKVATGNGDSVCLGWFTMPVRKYRMVRHSGGDPGFTTYFGFIPEKGMAVVVMGNNELFKAYNMVYMILTKVLFNKIKDYRVKRFHYDSKVRQTVMTKDISQLKKLWLDAKKSKNPGFAMKDWHLDDLGYWLIRRKHYQKAVNVFLLLVELFPKEGGWYDSVGDGYRAWGKKALAIKWYKKSLEIAPERKDTQRKLKALTK